MSKVRVLPENIVNLIAAGEVIERPASVVKELIENSIDAGSTRIIVNLKEYGTELIEVIDNGIGMDEADARLAFELHATSKIQTETDLENILTLGFRGEALASIKSVADYIEVETKTSKSEPVKLKIENFNTTKLNSSLSDQGTSISIYNLFAKIPARRKFLKALSTELKHIIDTFINISLINTNIYFELKHNGKTLHKLTPTSSFKERVFEIWGGTIAKNLFDEIKYESNDCNIELYLGTPEIAKKSSPIQYAYVNNRFVVDKVISSAIYNAYTGFIHKDLKPTYFLHIHINPANVDVNIHPKKLEIKFVNSQEIYKILYTTVKKALEKNTKELLFSKFQDSSGTKLEKSPTFIQQISTPKIIDTKPKFNSYTKQTYDYPSPKAGLVKEALSFTQVLYDSGENKLANAANPKIESAADVMTNNHIGTPYTQFFKTYITFEKEDKIIFVDQHAAAEKILFEKLLNNFGSVKSKPLLIPDVLTLTPHDKDMILEQKEVFENLSLEISDFGKNSIQVSAIPEVLDNFHAEEFFAEFFESDSKLDLQYSKDFKDNNSISKQIYYAIAKTACHGAIRAGQSLTSVEMNQIINDLQTIKNPYNCPHGRPVMWELKKGDLEKNFKRII